MDYLMLSIGGNATHLNIKNTDFCLEKPKEVTYFSLDSDMNFFIRQLNETKFISELDEIIFINEGNSYKIDWEDCAIMYNKKILFLHSPSVRIVK